MTPVIFEDALTLRREAQTTHKEVQQGTCGCLVCTNLKLAVADDPIIERAKQVNALEQAAIFGRCDLCNLALSMWDGAYKTGMHNNCAADLYD